MKTGYVYIVALNGRFGRVLRLGTSLRNPAQILGRYSGAGGKRRAPKLIGFEFVEDLIGADAQIRADLRKARPSAQPRTFRCGAAAARAALRRAAQRQAVLRKARFHAQTGLLIDPDVELAGPVTAFSDTLAATLLAELGPDLGRLRLYLHPYMVGIITMIFRERQRTTKIPDEYLPEILRDIAWRSWKCRLKPQVFVRMGQRTRREQSYLDLARYAATRVKMSPDRLRPGQDPARFPQLVAFVRAPEAHLSETMRGYAEALARAPAVKLRNIAFRLVQLLCLMAALFALDSVLQGGGQGRWLSGLLMLFFAGAAALTFNLYEKPDLTRGIGVFSRKEVEAELSSLRGRGLTLDG